MKNILVIACAIFTLGLSSCSEEWISDVVPTDKLDADNAFGTIKDARNAVNGVFSIMQDDSYYGADYIVYGDLKATDVRSFKSGVRDGAMYIYSETTEASTSTMWTTPYTCLVSTNNAIVNFTDFEVADADIDAKNEILANLHALRALNHFDLLKVYARIPASLSTPVDAELGIVIADRVITKEEKPERSNLKESYDFVIADLNKAIELMPASANASGWFNINAVKALLSRVYLYNGDNQLSYDLAKEVIDTESYSLIPYGDYKESWTEDYNNSEAILTIINTAEDNASREGIGYLWFETGYNTMSLTNSFMAIVEANAADDRNNVFDHIIKKEDEDDADKITAEYGLFYKYPNSNYNNVHVIRLSEMYFIAAEAAFNLGNSQDAADLMNVVIKTRTEVENVVVLGDVSIERILLEKRKEFVGEGHAFFDLMRNNLDVVRTGVDHLVTAPMLIEHTDFLTIQPIPRIELNSNKNIQQNPGYAE